MRRGFAVTLASLFQDAATVFRSEMTTNHNNQKNKYYEQITQ